MTCEDCHNKEDERSVIENKKENIIGITKKIEIILLKNIRDRTFQLYINRLNEIIAPTMPFTSFGDVICYCKLTGREIPEIFVPMRVLIDEIDEILEEQME